MEVEIENILTKINGKIITQGWSPQCLKHPSPSNEKWGVLKTTAIQQNEFREYENKELPADKTVREHLQVQKGDILMTCAGPRNRCGVACVVKKVRPKLLLSGKMYRFQPNEKVVITSFLNHFLQSQEAWRAIDKMKTGGSESGLNLTHSRFRKLPLRIAPLPEQRAIVAKIEELFSSLDHGIAQLERVRAQLKVYRQAVLKKAFEGELTKEWRARQTDLPTAAEIAESTKKEREADFARRMEVWAEEIAEWEADGGVGKKPRKPKRVGLNYSFKEEQLEILEKLPNYFYKEKLANICLKVTDGDHQAPPKAKEGIPFITISNIKDNVVNFSKTHFVGTTYYNSLPDYRKPKEGDILYTVTGSYGIPVLIDYEKSFCFQRHIGLIRPLKSVNQKWLFWLLQSQLVFTQAMRTATGTAQKTVGLSSLRNFIISYCSSEEQTQIVQEIESRLSVCDNIAETVEVSLQKAESLRQSILKRAFAGELLTAAELARCRAEAVLLEKIRGEKDRLKK